MRITKGGLFPGLLSTAADAGAIGGVAPQNSPSQGGGQALVSNGSNTAAWQSVIQGVTSNGSNTLLGPYVNFASGTGITFAIASNTLTINGSAGGSLAGALTVINGGGGTVQAHGNLGSTETIDTANGNYHWGTLNANCTFTFATISDTAERWFTLELIEDGTGGWTVTWPGSVAWLGGSTPAHTTTAGTTTIYAFFTRNGGTTWIGGQLGASGGGSAIEVFNEGVSLTAALASLDFVGAGVTATTIGDAVTVTIPSTGIQLASITAASSAIAATEAVVVSASLPANSIVAGNSYRITGSGVGTTGVTPGTDTFRIRIGTTTLTGTIPTSTAALGVAAVTGQSFNFVAIITVRTSGGSGTVIGECVAFSANVATGRYATLNNLSATTATVALDTTVTNLLELTFQSGNAGSSNTFHVASIEQLTVAAGAGTDGIFALVTNSAAQTRNDAALQFDTEVKDASGFFSGGAPSRFTVPSGQGGTFRLSGGGYAQTGAYRYAIFKNGSNVRSGHTATTDYGEINFVLPLVATDYVELFGIAGANRDYGHASLVDAQSWFSIERIGA